MSKVFSAKRKTVEFEYEFLDGTNATLKARTLSTKEQEELQKEFKDGDIVSAVKKQLQMILAGNDKEIVKKLIEEQYENGDLIEFSGSINELIREEKEKK